MPIKRADGITESERYLKLLCDCTFLSLWSYSGVFRDQGLGKGTEGKEVCDLLLMLRRSLKFLQKGNLKQPNTRRFKALIACNPTGTVDLVKLFCVTSVT